MVKRGFSFVLVLLFFSVFFVGFGSAALTDGLVGYWPLDEQAGTTSVDYSVYSRNGTIYGSPSFNSTCKLEGCINFDGSDDYVGVSNIDFPQYNVTFSTWIRRTGSWTSPDSLSMAVSGGHTGGSYSDPFFGRWDWATMGFGWYSSGYRYAAAPSELNLNQWYHLTGTYDGQTIRFYVDGNNVANTSYTGAIPQVNTNFLIGGTIWGGAGFFWTGQLDEVAIWNRSLSVSEVSQLYNSGNGLSLLGPTINLVSPTNASYFSTNNVTINFTASNADFIWYNNGTGGANSTAVNVSQIPYFVDYFNASEGQYNFTFYANNSQGTLSSSTITFWIDTTNPLIEYIEDVDGLVGTPANASFFARDWIFMNISYNESFMANVTFNLFSDSDYSGSLTDNLVGYWLMDEVSGTTAADYRGINNAIISGTVTLNKPGQIDTSYEFSSGSMRVNSLTSFDSANSWTISTWINSASDNPSADIMEYSSDTTCNENPTIYFNAANTLSVNPCGTGTFFSFGTITQDVWTHIVAVYNGTHVITYTDGSLVEMNEYSSFPSISNGRLTIGAQRAGDGQYFNGNIDEFVVWGRALSSSEITELYNSGNGRSLVGARQVVIFPVDLDNGLVGYWPLDDNVNDYSGSANDGTEYGGIVSGVSGKVGNAYQLDGSDDYISVSDSSSLDISGPLTLQAWLKLDPDYSCSGSAYPSIIGKNSDYTGYGLWLKDSSCHFTAGFGSWVWGDTILNSPTKNVWYHYLVSYDGDKAIAYVNGNNIINFSGSDIPLNDASLIMGKHYSQNVFWKGYLDEVAIWNRELNTEEISYLYNSGEGRSPIGYNFSNYGYLSNNFTSLADGTYSYNVTICDLAGNCNSTETRQITIDASAPDYSDLIYSPNDTVSLDPSENITINVTISETLSEIDSVTLYYNYTLWNETSSDLIQILNESFSGDLNLANYSFSFPTQDQNATYYFYLFMNDTNGNAQNSSLVSFNSTWDCIWAINTSRDGLDFGTIGGFNQELLLGNITLYNYGDPEYHINNCTLRFGRNRTSFQIFDQGITSPSSIRLNFSGDYRNSDFSSFGESQGIRYYLDGETSVTSLTLNASENKTLSIKALFPILPSGFSVLEEAIFFPIEAVVGSNITNVIESLSDIVSFLGSSAFVTHWGGSSSAIIRANMVVTPGAYLDLLVEDEPSNEIIDLKEGQYYFTVSVKNVVDGESNPNNTAYDVYFNVTLPSEIESLFTNTTYSTLSIPVANDTTKYYITVRMDLNSSNLASLQEENYTVKFFAYGYENSTGNLTLINHSSGEVLEESIFFEFRCPSQSYTGLKSDICIPATLSTSSSGGSGGGGGGGAGTATIKTEATFELVRGEQTEFQLPITNTYPNQKKNITIKIKGVESKYVSISPETISSIPANSSKNITVTLTAPAYFSQNSSVIEFEINGIVDSGNQTYPFKENKFVKLVILEFSKEQAIKYLNASEETIRQMNESDLVIKEVSKLYGEMKNYFASYSYKELKENYDLLDEVAASAFESRDLIAELEKAIEKAEKRGIEILETKKLLFAAETLFERGEYISALEKLREAKASFALETKGEFNVLYEIKNNPLQALGILIGVGLFGLGASLGVRYRYLKSKIKLLGEEADLIVQLMKVVQKECFEYGKMHMDEYQLAMAQYEKRLTETIEDRISSETKLAYLGQLHSQLSSLTQEKKRIIGLMQGLQESYLKKGQMETRLYENMMKIYSQRLSKVDEQLALIEAKEFLKKSS